MKRQLKASLILSVMAAIIIISTVFAASPQNVDYTATVSGTPNIVVTLYDGGFGACTPGSSCSIVSSLNFANLGNQDPNSHINATFTTNVSAVYGLNSSNQNIINGTLFQLNNTALTATTLGTMIILNSSIGAGENFTVQSTLTVPNGQVAGAYAGTVQISWVAS